MEDNLAIEQLEGNVEEQEESEITPEMIAQRQTALKRLLWLLVIMSVIILAFIIWELVDLMGAH